MRYTTIDCYIGGTWYCLEIEYKYEPAEEVNGVHECFSFSKVLVTGEDIDLSTLLDDSKFVRFIESEIKK